MTGADSLSASVPPSSSSSSSSDTPGTDSHSEMGARQSKQTTTTAKAASSAPAKEMVEVNHSTAAQSKPDSRSTPSSSSPLSQAKKEDGDAVRQRKAGLSDRGMRNLHEIEPFLGMIRGKRADVWTPENPTGSIPMAIADNQSMRKELTAFFNTPGKLALRPQDLTYADKIMCSERLLDAICSMVNTTPDGFFLEEGKREQWPKPVKAVKPEDIVVGNGASGILDAVFWALVNDGEGILLSQPHYNAFTNDTSTRDTAKLCIVTPPVPFSSSTKPKEPREHVEPDTIKYYADALKKAQSEGIKVKCLLICNPHNPTGVIYPRETIVALAKFAAQHDLHLVMDEIYSRTVYRTKDVEDPTPFYSILGIDVQKEAGLDPSRVHVISSASKDFSTNGFRLGYVISQHNEDFLVALLCSALLAQTAAPSANLFSALLEDKDFLGRYMTENRRRIAASYNYLTAFFKKHDVPYVPSNAGFFLLVDLRRYLDIKEADKDNEEEARKSEMRLLERLQQGKVTLAPGTIYRHPLPGFFRLTFTLDPEAVKLGCSRMEDIFGWEKWVDGQPLAWTSAT